MHHLVDDGPQIIMATIPWIGMPHGVLRSFIDLVGNGAAQRIPRRGDQRPI